MRNSSRGAAFGAALACLAAAPLGSVRGETLSVQGSSTFHSYLMVPYQERIEAAAGHKLNVISSKSSLGLITLLEGRADLAMISAPLESEIEHLRTQRSDLPFHKLRSFLISKVRIALAVHPSNPVRTTTLAKLRQVLNGAIDNWRDLKGPAAPIRVVMVGGGGGVTRTVEVALFEGTPLQPRHPIKVGFGSQVPKFVAEDHNALGLAQLAEVRRHHLPELRTDRPIEQDLYLVTLGEPSPTAGAVIAAARRIAFGEE
jgi:phosphate transport system substrate-binding protein